MHKLSKTMKVLSISLSLTACAPVYHTTYQYIPPTSHFGKHCAYNCIQMRQLCSMRSDIQNHQCKINEMQEANFQYQAYIFSREHQRLPINLGYNDFYDGTMCNQSYHCLEDFNQCYATCGGEVIPHTQCIAFCGKKAA